MFALQVKAIFKIKDQGYVLAGTLQDPTATIQIGDYLNIETEEVRIQVKGVEHLNYRSGYKERREEFGILVDVSEQEAKALTGKMLFKEEADLC